ncbi:N-acetyltransferase family protein [Sphingomonas oryzagri]
MTAQTQSKIRLANETGQRGEQLTTRSGFVLRVRAVTDEDEALLAEFFTHVTPDDLRFRFLSSVSHVSPDQLRAMTHVDHRQTESFLGFSQDGSRLVAVATLACDPTLTHAEVAIVIRSDYKARGIGWELLHHVAGIAATRGVRTIESLESRENHGAIDVEEDSGFRMEAVADDPTVVRVIKTLTPRD